MTQEIDSGGKQVIARAASVLKSLENQRQGLSLSQIAKASDLPRTTVHRIVAALEAQQMVITGSGGIRLGPALARLAASAHMDVVAIARPYVESLGRRTRETVDVSVYRGLHAVSVDQYPSDQELRVVSSVGTAFPIHSTAHGKALLTAFSEDAVRRLLTDPLESRTPLTLTTVDAVIKSVSEAQVRGWAVDEEEHAKGVCGIGVYLQSGLAEHYAISLAIPALRFYENRESLKAALLQCKAEIESVIGV
ncbi:IclR family transcriptional regulator [Pseudomonas chlororaphis]|uniref:IclR family transcriptional regulator n=1 Tax=Pseudomonas chlororaphis TaxID=587753 RepID=UPI001925EBC9|nr:IclR family transcriptional regulator [Pseudomonas chlororaphis]QQX57449.1 IclR family transcriptional regulator [Pseudomonas chlororaphis subsp. aurantiaca]